MKSLKKFEGPQVILQKVFSDKSFNQKLLGLAMPVMIQNLMAALVGAADALMLCSCSQDAMAAIALATQIQFMQAIIIGSLMSGISIMGAQYWGKRDISVLEKLFAFGVNISTFFSLFFCGGCLFAPELLMKLFTADPKLIHIGAEYLQIVAFSCLFFSFSRNYLTVMRVTGHLKLSSSINIMTVLLNVLFNAVFIFGLLGIPALGVKGAAFATLLARFVELLVTVLPGSRKGFIALRFKRLITFEKDLILDYCRYTLPVIGSFLLWSVGFTSYTAILGHLGKDAAAANAIAAVVRNLCCCICDGLAAGTSIMVGHELGAGNLRQAKLYGSRSFILSFIVGIAAAIFIVAMPFISASVSLTGEAHHYLKGMLLVLAFYMIGRCVSGVTTNGIFAAGGDTLFNVKSLIIAMWCVALPCAFLGAFYFHWPVVLVYACTCLDEVGKVPFLAMHYRKYKWVKNITRA